MAKTPITDSINKQFDQWEIEIDELKKEGTEQAKKQAKQLMEEVKSWAKTEQDDLSKQSSETEKSPIAEKMEKIQNGIKELKPDPEKIQKIIDTIKDVGEMLNTIVQGILDTGLDLTKASITLPQRLAKLQSKITEI